MTVRARGPDAAKAGNRDRKKAIGACGLPSPAVNSSHTRFWSKPPHCVQRTHVRNRVFESDGIERGNRQEQCGGTSIVECVVGSYPDVGTDTRRDEHEWGCMDGPRALQPGARGDASRGFGLKTPCLVQRTHTRQKSSQSTGRPRHSRRRRQRGVGVETGDRIEENGKLVFVFRGGKDMLRRFGSRDRAALASRRLRSNGGILDQPRCESGKLFSVERLGWLPENGASRCGAVAPDLV